MTIEKLKKKIESYESKWAEMVIGKQYYKNETRIKETGVTINRDSDPIRRADNRISHNFHEVLVAEKSSYMFTYPVQFDIGRNEKYNKLLKKILGDDFERKTKNLCINASNCGVAWLHYWINTGLTGNNIFSYASVNPEEICPIYDNGLERKLKAIIRKFRIYEEVDYQENDDCFAYIEYWTPERMSRYKFLHTLSGKPIEETHMTNPMGQIPFIEFCNNDKKQSDLNRYKDLIDLYDRVMSGFANDLEDIQQIIYILENYGGQDLGEFLSDLKRYKAIKTDPDREQSGGVRTLQIEIPTEARKIVLEVLKKQIYESGQGLQQDIESVGSASGVALKFFYRKLELKAGAMETEFRSSFSLFIKVIMDYIGIPKDLEIIQTFTRNMISNDIETAQIAQNSVGIISDRTITKNHPWCEDLEEELKQIKKEKDQIEENNNTYTNSFGNEGDNINDKNTGNSPKEDK